MAEPLEPVRRTYDHRPYLPAYGFPADMTGMKILDAGRASGFFSFEFERRGAEVLALELPSPLQKDFVGGEFTRGIKAEKLAGRDAEHGEYGGRADFMTAHRLLSSRVRSLYCSVYDVDADRTNGETFDLVFLGSTLNHLAHPIAALTAVRSVTKGVLVVANPFEPERRQRNPVAHFVGRKPEASPIGGFLRSPAWRRCCSRRALPTFASSPATFASACEPVPCRRIS